MLSNSTPPNTSYTHDVDNRLLTAGSTTFSYDNNGNLVTKTLGSNITNYSWDFNDMLTQVTNNGNTYTYRYDALGSRVAKIVNSVETRYIGDLAETDASGNITAYYIYGLGLISKITPTNQAYFYHFDGIGSTVAITDSSGAIVNKYSYDEYGKVLSQEEAISNPFKYVGQFGVMDEGNGLLYMRARFYDPEVGRFISKDPIGFAGGDLNLYSYVANNPVNWIDPEGLLFGINAGESYGEDAAFYWASKSIDSNNAWYETATYTTMGLFASLWTPCTSEDTFYTLATAYMVGQANGRIIIDGPKGTRKIQFRDSKTGKPYFRADKGPVPGKKGDKWHYHRRPDLKKHRPYEGW